MINRRVLKLSIPSILANITVPLVGMVDIAVAGRLGNAGAIGAIAVGTMLFDILYWNFGFLRVGIGGLTAQSYGRRDFKDSVKYFGQGIVTALGISMLLFLIQYLFLDGVFMLLDTSQEVESFARQYFFIRIWAAPATLGLYVFKGWFIGMQNTVSPMAVDIVVNVVNFVMSIYLCLYTPLGFKGVALGTVVAQYTGLVLAVVLVLKYYKKLFRAYLRVKELFVLKDIIGFFKMNGDLFIRSLGFMAVYSGFTSLSADYGDIPLAVNSIMMKLLMLFSFFIDGFAYAGEALSGRYIGARDLSSLKKAVRVIFIWGAGIALVSTFVYWIWGDNMFRLMTSSSEVLDASVPYLPWLILMPIISCAAFVWDGIYVGATSTVAIRNTMIFAAIGFYIVYFITAPFFGVHSLWIAYYTHLIVRTLYMSFTAKKHVYSKALLKS